MDNESIAIEIDKYLRNPNYPLSKIVRKAIIEDFIPSALGKFSIDKDSIKESPIGSDDSYYEFSANGEMTFTDPASKTSITVNETFHGIAHIAEYDERNYVDFIEIDRIPSSKTILSHVIIGNKA